MDMEALFLWKTTSTFQISVLEACNFSLKAQPTWTQQVHGPLSLDFNSMMAQQHIKGNQDKHIMISYHGYVQIKHDQYITLHIRYETWKHWYCLKTKQKLVYLCFISFQSSSQVDSVREREKERARGKAHKLHSPGHLMSPQPQAGVNGGVIQHITTALVPWADN